MMYSDTMIRFRVMITLLIVVSIGAAVPFAAADSSSDQVTVQYAQGFTVEYHDGYKLVTVSNAWRGSDTTFTYMLIPRGSVPPVTIPGAEVIEIPSQRFVALSTTYLAGIEILGVTDSLAAVKGIGVVNSDDIQRRYTAGQVKDVGGSGSGMTTDLNMELLMDIDPDLIMSYAMGDPKYDSYLKAQEAGLTVVINGESMETTPLGRAEWIKFIALFFNKEKEANEYFDKISREYQDIAKSVSASGEDRPTVFANTNYKGTWYMPGGDSYVARFLTDAGASYLWSDDRSTGSLPLDFEVVYTRASGADYWINAGTATSLKALESEDAKYREFAAFASGNVYSNNAKVNAAGGNDYWQSGVAHPEIILKDLVKIFHPDLVPDHTWVYYQKLV